MTAQGKRRKTLLDYLEDPPERWPSSLTEYSQRPACALLAEIVHLSDSINHCLRLFTKTSARAYTKDSEDSLYRLNAAVLAGIMGHFETFERSLFAGMLEASRLIPEFDVERCCKELDKDRGLPISAGKISAYRGQPTAIGRLVADNLTGWQDPEKVISHFKTLLPKVDVFSRADQDILRLLWQLRHSIVHTAGWLSQPDSQKVRGLRFMGNRPILLGGRFIETVTRQLHPLVNRAVSRLAKAFQVQLPSGLSSGERAEVSALFEVKSPRMSWLK